MIYIGIDFIHAWKPYQDTWTQAWQNSEMPKPVFNYIFQTPGQFLTPSHMLLP